MYMHMEYYEAINQSNRQRQTHRHGQPEDTSLTIAELKQYMGLYKNSIWEALEALPDPQDNGDEQ